MKRLIFSSAAALGLLAAPLAANQAAAERASQPVPQGEQLTADSNLFFILGIAAVAAAIVLLAEDEEGAPASP